MAKLKQVFNFKIFLYLCFAKNLTEALCVPIVIHVFKIGNITQNVNNFKFPGVNHVFSVTDVYKMIHCLQMMKSPSPVLDYRKNHCPVFGMRKNFISHMLFFRPLSS